MRIQVHTTPNAKKSEVIELSPAGGESFGELRTSSAETRVFKIRVNAKAVDGKANIRLIEILAEHFKVPFDAIRIMSGATSREKVIEIVG